VIESKRIAPIGSVKARPIDVRFIAATNRLLAEEAMLGTFRKDLYFRLAGLSFTIPPLRDRRDEILTLAEQFLREACRQQRRPVVPSLSESAAARLMGHSWPGNIRELKNVLERAALFCAGVRVEPHHVWFDDLSAGGGPAPARPAPAPPMLAEPSGQGPASERGLILAALDRCAGNQTKAARLLGMARSTLTLRLEALDLPRPRKARP
jgi:two-component system response regulator AtoC